VAVHSEADAGARHVRESDVAVRIGKSPAPLSYLNPAATVRAALDTGAEAVHPGYGFLAESPTFARAVMEAGLAWVGPAPEVLELTGDRSRPAVPSRGPGSPCSREGARSSVRTKPWRRASDSR
jgi:acetyl/propionyl-CoA carboxylase alpha subunit